MNKKTFQNYGDIANAEKEVDEICRMCWFDDEERKVLCELFSYKNTCYIVGFYLTFNFRFVWA